MGVEDARAGDHFFSRNTMMCAHLGQMNHSGFLRFIVTRVYLRCTGTSMSFDLDIRAFQDTEHVLQRRVRVVVEASESSPPALGGPRALHPIGI